MKHLRLILVAVALLVVAGNASAQVTYTKSGNSAAGIIVPVFNSVDTLLVDGTWLMADTTTAATTNLKRIVVKKWGSVVTADTRFVGIAVGPIQKSSKGGNGNMLVYGYHPTAIMSPGISAFAGIGPSMIFVGGGNALPDTLESPRSLGFFIGYNGATSTRGKVWLFRGGPVR